MASARRKGPGMYHGAAPSLRSIGKKPGVNHHVTTS